MNTIRYGREWSPECSDLDIELMAFSMGLTVEQGGLGKAEHFWRVVDMLFNYPGSKFPVDRTPWAEWMIQEACDSRFLSVAGCASSGKSGTFALWGIINFLANPQFVKVIVTSTSLKAAKKRIWGSVVNWWRALPEGMPGKLVDSMGAVRFLDDKGNPYDTSGLELIACEPKQEKEAVAKLIGFKQENLILIADELPDLSESILQAALGNLSVLPNFQMAGLGNPNSFFDAFGVFSEPKEGWGSWHREMDRWETKYGVCIRLDAYKSVNYTEGKDLYPWMPKCQWIEDQKNRLGENSNMFWRMVRGCWSPTGAEDSIFSENDIAMYGGEESPVWRDPPTLLAGLDPNFTTGGDRTVVCLAELGTDIEGKKVLHFVGWEALHEDATSTKPRNFQIAEIYKELCLKKGIQPFRAGVDSTGGGGPFKDILTQVWSDKVLAVAFGGSAPDKRAVSATDAVPCKVRYSNKVSYLWFSMVNLLRNGQLKGIQKDVAAELTARKYSTRKAAPHPQDDLGICYIVESKKDMIARMGKSPDLADSAAVVVELAIERLGLIPGEFDSSGTGQNSSWDQIMQEADLTDETNLIYDNNYDSGYPFS